MTVIGAVIAYAFAGQGGGHTVILVAMLIGFVFLLIEARRYRRYDIWRSRARVLQENLMANALDPSEGVEQEDWREQLSRDYRDPEQKLSTGRRSLTASGGCTFPFLLGLLAIWLFHLSVYGGEDDWTANAAIEGVPGILVIGTVLAFYAVVVGLALVQDVGGETESGIDHAELERRW